MNNFHEVILDKHWFTAHDPIINWRTHHVSFENGDGPPNAVLTPVLISSAEFARNLKQSNYEEIYRIKFCQVSNTVGPREAKLQSVLDMYQDIFPKKLPDALPPHRSMESRLL